MGTRLHAHGHRSRREACAGALHQRSEPRPRRVDDADPRLDPSAADVDADAPARAAWRVVEGQVERAVPRARRSGCACRRAPLAVRTRCDRLDALVEPQVHPLPPARAEQVAEDSAGVHVTASVLVERAQLAKTVRHLLALIVVRWERRGAKRGKTARHLGPVQDVGCDAEASEARSHRLVGGTVRAEHPQRA